MIAKINELLQEVEALTASNAEELEALRIKYLSKKGAINELMADFRSVPAEQKKEVGMKLNELTRTAYPIGLGTRHPLSIVKNEIIDIFARMGFSIADGPEVEDDLHVYTKLNFAADHPARDMQDSFYITEDILMRSQTSPVQARTMQKNEPNAPIRMIAPGRVYRRDEYDATHSPMFTQVEGLVIDEGITFADLKGTLELFLRQIFSEDVKVRLRPSFFPFTEPSTEVDISCVMCHGKGCKVCKGTGWLEILGAGMVHPHVLEMSGYDPKKVSGFAFGMGVERIAMLSYGVDDLRLFYDNDMRFLRQF